MKVRRLAAMGVLTALALILFMVEAQIPMPVPIPGVKLGLANIITVFAVFAMGSGDAAAILFCRVFLGAIFSGNFSTIFYSAAGGLCAILITIGLKRILTLKQLGRHNKPIAVLNLCGYFDPMIEMLRTTVSEGFMREACLHLFGVFTRPEELLDYLESYDENALDVRHLKNI